MPLIGGDKIRSLIKNATKDSSTGSNESLMKTNTRDSNNMIKDSDQLEMDRKNKIIVDNLKKSGWIVNKTQWIIGDLKKSEPKNMWGGINVSQWWNLNNSEIKSNWNINNPKNFIGVNAIDNLRRLWWIKVEDKAEKNSWRLGNEYKGIEHYTENSEKMWKAVNDLYRVTSNVLNSWEDVDIMRIREKFPEFWWLEDDVLENLISDVKNMVVDWDDNLRELVDAYPELWLVSSIDLWMNGRVEMINGLLKDDDGILDWILDKLGVGWAVKRKTGKSIKENLDDWANDSRDKKKIALGGNEIEDAFLRDLQERYSEYTNENGEWLPGVSDEIKKQHKREWDKYENKIALRAAWNLLKWLPSYLELWYNMVNHLPDMVKWLAWLFVGWSLRLGEKIDEKTRLNGLDKLAKERWYDSWEELKEVAYENMWEKWWWLNNFLLSSDTVTDSFINYLEDTYGGIFQGDTTKLEQSLQERGEDVLSDAMAVLDILNGVGKASGLISPETSSKLRSVSNMLDPANVGVNLVTGWTKAIVKAEARTVEKVLGKGMKAISGWKDVLEKSFIGRGTEMVINQLTNLTKEERDFIKNNYDIVDEYLKGNRSAEDIADLIRNKFDDAIEGRREVGKFYDLVKDSNKLVKTSEIVSWIKWMLNELGIKVEKDGLKFWDISYTPSQQRQLQQVYSYIKALEGQGDNVIAKDVWRVRQLIDNMADWEGNSKRGLDAEVMNSIRDMRNRVDEALKEQVEGFREADLEYKERSNLIKELRKDWFDKEGNLKENALSKIRNLTRGGNEAKLERLEKNFPWITNSLKGLAVAQSVERAWKAMVGQYAKQVMTVGWIFGLLNGNLSLATALLGMSIVTPKNLVKILKMQSNFEKVWKTVADKLDKWEVLSARDNSRLFKWLRRNEIWIRNNVDEAMKSKDWERIDLSEVDREYDKAQKSAYFGGKSTEWALTEKERSSLLKKYNKWGWYNEYVVKTAKDMADGVKGMTDLRNGLIQLQENFGDTTIQHEVFHKIFNVVDEQSKKYVIDEVKKYLNLKDDVAAEERLAESFGIYIRRKEIKLGEIRLKGNRLQRFQSKLRDLFQRAYEWIQNYSMDRKTINKMFNEVYGAVDGKVLDESWKFNLAEKLGINEKTPKLWVSENWLRYKKGWNLEKNDYTTTNWQADRPLLWNLATTEWGVKKPTYAEGGRENRGSQNAHLGKVGNHNMHSASWLSPFLVKNEKGELSLRYNWRLIPVNKELKVDSRWHIGGRDKSIHTTNYKFNLNKNEGKYLDNFMELVRKADNEVYSKNVMETVWKTELWFDVKMTKDKLRHLIEHWWFEPENLIKTLMEPDYTGENGWRPMYLKKIPNSDSYYVLGLTEEVWEKGEKYYRLKTFYEDTAEWIWDKYKYRVDNSKAMRFKRAYHWSAADFKKFDSSHMGEGEWAQAHWWGHYVAVDRNTAKSYAEMKGADFEYKWKKLDWRVNYSEQSVEERVANQIYWELKDGKKWDEAIKNLKGYAEWWIRDYERKANNAESEGMRKYYRESMKEEIDWLKMLDKMKEEDFVNKGGRNLYRLEIPDPVKRNTPTGSNYIEESKWVSETLYNKIHKLLWEKYPEIKDGYQQNLPYYNWRKTTWYGNWKELYEQISGILWWDKQASKFLESLWYDGIHYFGGIDWEAYVIFWDDSTKIKSHIRYKKDKLRPGEIDYGNKGLQYKWEISRWKVKEFLSKNMSKEELIRNIGRYDEAKKEFDVDLKKRAKELNGREVTTSIKMRNMDDSLREGGIKRIMEKQEKKGKIGWVRDIVRGTVIVEGKDWLKKALDKFYKEGQGVDDKYSFIGENDMGYRDLSFVYYTKNGIPCEVQVNVPEMMVAKDGKNLVDWWFIKKSEYDDIVKKAGVEGGEWHKMYEKYRDLNEERKWLVKLINKKWEKNMWKEIKRIRDIDEEMDRIEKESREYYKKFEDLIK